jgi:hypothetical protein
MPLQQKSLTPNTSQYLNLSREFQFYAQLRMGVLKKTEWGFGSKRFPS